jgi:hypothetical protein
MDDAVKRAVLDLLEEAPPPITPDDILSRTYWLDLNPHLTISEDALPLSFESHPLGSTELEELADALDARGYFHTRPVLSLESLERLLEGIEQLRAHRVHPAFCFVYDEYWAVTRTCSVSNAIAAVLGPGFLQFPDVWCHYVQPLTGASGWRPHIDAFGEGSLTVWIPLTEASLENGCMYIIPRDLAPPGGLDGGGVLPLLQATRALPANPGEFLGWDFDTIHWGSSASNKATSPRVSLSYDFLAARFASSRALFSTSGALPSFEMRLLSIERNFHRYESFEPAAVPYRKVLESARDRIGTSLPERTT